MAKEGPAFETWAASEGVVQHCVRASAVTEGGRGVVAARDIAAGECLCSIPEGLLMTTRSAQSDPALQSAIEGMELSEEQVLVLHLLFEVHKGASSRWYPYLKQMPKSYSTLSNFRGEEMAALQASHAVSAAESAVRRMRKSWGECREVLERLGVRPGLQKVGAWAWGLSTVLSRTVFHPGDRVGALCPFGDLFNYAAPPPPGSTQQGTAGDGAFDQGTAMYKFWARRSYVEGEQVYMCYGRYTQLELLETYGFILDDNPHDGVPLHPTEVLAGASMEAGPPPRTWWEGRADWPEGECELQADGSPSWALLVGVRLACLGPREEARDSARGDGGIRAGAPAPGGAEMLAWRLLWEGAARLLLALPTTAKEDTALLAAGVGGGEHEQGRAGGGPRAEVDGSPAAPGGEEQVGLAVRWRLGHKRLLQRAVRYAAEEMERLAATTAASST